MSIRSCLEHVSKGWFNMEESDFEVYQGSKLKKLMELIKFAMQVSFIPNSATNVTNTVHYYKCMYVYLY